VIHAGPQILRLSNGQQCHSAKFFPIIWWNTVVKACPDRDFIQIGVQGDSIINNVRPNFDLPENEIIKLCLEAENIICVESFLPHLLAPYKLSAIVLFSKSSPVHYGYPWNRNLLKDNKYLRPDQFMHWGVCPIDPDAFIEPQSVINLLTQPASL
jgi:ADP-heptose:LPS heptosyltransferase